MILIITDAYSKWLDVKVTKSITAAATIGILDEVFATYGVPLMVVSDNGTNFTSSEFNKFLTNVGVKYHKYTAPYHPSTNGQAERNVQTVKNALKAMCTTKGTLNENLNEFLRQYRNAPHYTTGQSPAQLFLDRQLRTRLDLVRPEEMNTKVHSGQYLKSNGTFRHLVDNQMVYFLSGNPRICKWLKGKVSRRLGDIHYEISFQGKFYKRHIDQIRGIDDESTQERITANASLTDNANRNNESTRNGTSHQGELTTGQDELTTVNSEEQSGDFSTPPAAMEFRGFTPTSSTGLSASTPNPEGVQREGEVRRSTRVRRPRVLFSP